MEAIKCIGKFFTPKESLHKAAEKGNYREVERLINLGLNVNAYYADCTPLQNCLNSPESDKNKDCALSAILLLEHGADPNASYKFQYPKKTIQTHVNGGNLSKIRLLIMFGATPEGVNFHANKSEIKHFFLSTQHDYQTIKQLEKKFSQSHIDNKQKVSLLKEIGKIWEKLSKDETNVVYQSYYQEKANHYYDLANNLNPCLIVNEKLTDNSCTLRYRFEDEKKPLLIQENKPLTL